MKPVILLELNEINMHSLLEYAQDGSVPHLARLINENGLCETTSEDRYEDIEPWIQWVTAHTGLPLDKHQVFRLGDIVKHEIPQIWERLEEHGFRVGAVSPMNAKNRTRNAAFFVPDPWTPTRITAKPVLRNLYGAIAQAVNDNSQSRITPRSAFWLAIGALAHARTRNYRRYMALASSARSKPWRRAMFLDLLLADTFLTEVKRKRPDFSSLFLNAGAHIQHHYMFNSRAYDGESKNPPWYVDTRCDPVGEVYSLYDRIVGDVLSLFPDARIMIATGLHQDPNPGLTYYWRLRDHEGFLTRLGVTFSRVDPRMSRDFIVTCPSVEDAAATAKTIQSLKSRDGLTLFDVDNRGDDLFVTLTWPHDVGKGFDYYLESRRLGDLSDEVAFVAIKNGRHNGTGYFIDTGETRADAMRRFPLSDLPKYVCSALGADWDSTVSA